MNKILTHIEQNITGIWYNNNNNYSFAFSKNGSSNNVSYKNKKIFPNGGSQGKFWIKEHAYGYVLEIILFDGENPASKMILIVEDFDSTSLKVRSINNDVEIFTKVA